MTDLCSDAGRSVLPKVTVAIPTRNRVAFLVQALDSVLAQTYENIEVIVSDNASEDDTWHKLQKYADERLITVRQQHDIGMVGNWNACLNIASGEFFILLSDDDYLQPAAIERMISVFLPSFQTLSIKRENIGIVYCRYRITDKSGELVGLSRRAPFLEDAKDLILFFFQSKRHLVPCATLFRTHDLRALSGYPVRNFPLGADAYAWMNIVLQRGYAFFIDEQLSNYRVHCSNVTRQVDISMWLEDNRVLARMVTEYFQDQSDFDYVAKINTSIKSFNARIASGLINQAVFSGSITRGLGVKKYFDFWPYFSSLGGLIIFVTGLAKILVPNAVIQKFRSSKKHALAMRRSS